MNDSRFKLILYIIAIVILGTISIQVYWNYKNYLVNKQQLINDVQISLDNAVGTYYADLAEENTLGEFRTERDSFNRDSLIHRFKLSMPEHIYSDSIDVVFENGISLLRFNDGDSIINSFNGMHDSFPNARLRGIYNDFSRDSVINFNFRQLTSRVIISLTNDTLQLQKIDTLLRQELMRKNLNVDYGLSFINFDQELSFCNQNIVESASLSTISQSPFLPHPSTLSIHFTNETKVILKRILTGILLSTLLVLAVISCLFYLLKIIRNQKQLAEVKNDLISNITHEFKTPIATIGVALESIKDFNVIEDKEKTKSYLDMSNKQLSKLNLMVEKLLETATLDSDSLYLNKEEFNIVDLINSIVEKLRVGIDNKELNFSASKDEIVAKVDIFHFENALNNVLDNAIKYGGKNIIVNLKQLHNSIEISISDDGNSLTKANKDRIFEKFYRIPKGNTHDIKGFGIGLYYSKKIIEKHGGSIHLSLDNKLTTFKINVPNE